MGWFGDTFGGIANGLGALKESIFGGSEAQQADEQRKKLLQEQAAAAGQFAGQGEAGYGAMTGELAKQRQFLMDLASGKNSIAAEQLRQGLQQNVAAQQSMAAGAAPQNAGMAARTAMLNTARLGSGLAGQQALAGLKERQDAQQALSALNLGQRGQDVNVALGSRGNALTGYGAGAQGQPEKGWLERNGQGILGLVGGAKLLSDKELKEEIRDGDDDANKMLGALRSRVYKYKDQRHGKGKQLGIVAQELEAAGLKDAVEETPIGKAVNVAKLSGANTSMLAALARRVEKLEGKGRK
jgi:hypothetical protein